MRPCVRAGVGLVDELAAVPGALVTVEAAGDYGGLLGEAAGLQQGEGETQHWGWGGHPAAGHHGHILTLTMIVIGVCRGFRIICIFFT